MFSDLHYKTSYSLFFQGHSGQGIQVTNNVSDIPLNEEIVVQKYIDNPHLINGTKYDMRIHVLLTSVNPLQIYIFDEGHVRFATYKYSECDWQNIYKHLTNLSVNKKNKDFDYKGWKLHHLWTYLESKGIDTRRIWNQIKDVIIKTYLVAEENLYNCNHNQFYNGIHVS